MNKQSVDLRLLVILAAFLFSLFAKAEEVTEIPESWNTPELQELLKKLQGDEVELGKHLQLENLDKLKALVIDHPVVKQLMDDPSKFKELLDERNKIIQDL